MSDGVQASQMPPAGSKIRNPQDFYGGLVIVVFALLAFWAAKDLPGMRGFAFGPGTAPRMFAIMLGLLGALIMVTGLFTDGPRVARFYIRGPLFVTASILTFAFLIRNGGMVVASYCSICVGAAATTESKPIETLLWAAVLTAFCVGVFPYALNLPLQLWPNSSNPLLWFSYR